MEQKFKVGDRVKCVNAGKTDLQSIIAPSAHNVGLVKERDYIVYQERLSECCGVQLVDVGVPIGVNEKGNICTCGTVYQNHGINWKSAFRFVKVQEQPSREVKVVKIGLPTASIVKPELCEN